MVCRRGYEVAAANTILKVDSGVFLRAGLLATLEGRLFDVVEVDGEAHGTF